MRTILTFITVLYYATLAAQTNDYSVTKTFYENGYTYQCDVAPSQLVRLYNKNNILTHVHQVYKETGKQPAMLGMYDITDLVDDSWTKPKCYSIVNSAFSEAEKQKIGEYELGVNMYISSETGKVIEVGFDFTTFEPFTTIPISVYRKIEVELKNNIWFTPAPEGKKLNFLMRFWSQKIE